MIKNISKQVSKAIIEAIGKKKCSLHEPWFDKSEAKYLSTAIKKNSVSTYGKETAKFENEIKKYTGSKYVCALINGTSALHLSLYLADVKKGDEVLIPALNYIASSNATLYLGASPHFIDVEEKTLGPNVEKLDYYLSKTTRLIKGKCFNIKTKKIIKALVVTHIFGHPSNLIDLIIISKKYKIKLIEDAAEGLGSFYNNQHLGTFGLMGILSFNGNKIITTGGGGAILTNSKKIADKMNLISRNSRHSHKWEYKYSELGFNYRMPSINAQLGLAQIKKLKKFIRLKRNLYLKYKSAFSKISAIKLFREPINSRSNYWLQTILLNKPSTVIQKLILKDTNLLGFGTRPIWNLLNKNKHLKFCPSMNLDTAKNLEKRIINLPSGAKLCQKI